MIDFVIPSIARSTLNRTLKSIQDQQFLFSKNNKWNAFVGFDGLEESDVEISLLPKEDRINYLFLSEKSGKVGEYGIGNAGLVRNKILEKIKTSNDWVGFIDDDDTITPYYLDSLAIELEQSEKPFDVCVFRMRFDPGGERILPPIGENDLIADKVGISFCVRKKFLKDKKIKFVNNIREDYMFLMDLKKAGANIKVSSYVTYNVGF